MFNINIKTPQALTRLKENETVLLFLSLTILSSLLIYSLTQLKVSNLSTYAVGLELSLYTCLIVYAWGHLGKALGLATSLLGLIFIFLAAAVLGQRIVLISIIPSLGATIFSYWCYKKEDALKQEKALKLESITEDKNDLEIECKKKIALHEALQERVKKFATLSEMAQVFSSTLNQQEISVIMVEKTMSLVGKGENGLLYLVDPEINRLRLAILKSNNPNQKPEKHLGKDGDVYDHWAIRHKQVLLIEDTRKDFRFKEEDSHRTGWPVSALMASPLIRGERIMGLLRLDSQKPSAFTTNDLRFLDIISDIGAAALENARLVDRTEELARRDSLTNLYVHSYFKGELTRQLQDALATSTPLSLLMMDIDDFKKYNDLYGHTVGDIVLKKAAKILLATTRGDAVVSRYGGEEFAVILPKTDKNRARDKAEEIRKAIERETIFIRNKETHITISVGVKTFPQEAMLPEELIKKADDALRQAKAEGKNRICS